MPARLVQHLGKHGIKDVTVVATETPDDVAAYIKVVSNRFADGADMTVVGFNFNSFFAFSTLL